MNIVSFSLYGTNPIYTVGAVENAKLMPTIYPGWTMRVYHGTEVPPATLEQLRKLGCQLFVMPHTYGGTITPLANNSAYGKFWRFLAIAEPQAAYVVFRDVDSRINPREAAAVADWINSGKTLHTMKDHINHDRFPILAGMWGIKGGAVDITGLLEKWRFSSDFYDDQTFLEYKVWPVVGHSHIRHGRMGQPFPAHQPYRGFVGQRVNANNAPMHD